MNYTILLLCKTNLTLSGSFEFYGHKTKPDYKGFNEDAGQFLLAQKGEITSIEIPKKLQEICEIFDNLIDHNMIDKSLMGPLMRRRLVELRAEEKALTDSGRQPTAAI